MCIKVCVCVMAMMMSSEVNVNGKYVSLYNCENLRRNQFKKIGQMNRRFLCPIFIIFVSLQYAHGGNMQMDICIGLVQ